MSNATGDGQPLTDEGGRKGMSPGFERPSSEYVISNWRPEAKVEPDSKEDDKENEERNGSMNKTPQQNALEENKKVEEKDSDYKYNMQSEDLAMRTPANNEKDNNDDSGDDKYVKEAIVHDLLNASHKSGDDPLGFS